MTQSIALPKFLQDVWRFRYVVYTYVQTTLRLRYRRSYLGFLWTALAPLAQYAVVGVMMKMLLRTKQIDNFFAHYFTGAIFFSLVSAILSRGPSVLIGNEHFIKKIYLPKLIFVLNTVCYETANFLLAFSTLMLLGMTVGMLPVNVTAPMALVGLVLSVFFLLGVAAILSVVAVYFRDLVNIVPVMLQALFFVTPIAFSRAMVPGRFRWAVDVNPLYYFLELVRRPIVTGDLPSLKVYGVCLAMAVVTPLLGIALLRRCDGDIVFRL